MPATLIPRSISARLVLLYVALVTTLLAAFGAFEFQSARRELGQRLQTQADAALARLGDSLPAALWDLDDKQVQKVLRAEMQAAFVEGLFIAKDGKLLHGLARGRDGQPAAADQPPAGLVPARIDLSYEDAGKRQALGSLTLYYSDAPTRALLRGELLKVAVQVLVLDAVLVVGLLLGLRAVVLRPLNEVRRALHEIGSGEADLTRRLPPQHSVEFAALSDDFNRFVDRLETMVGEVRRRAEEVALGTREIAQANQDLSQRTEQQSSRLQQASSAVEQLTGSVASNAGNAGAAHGHARQAGAVAQRGGELMGGVVATMQGIADSSRRVADIVGVIDTIAFQTNILALNAAVEAARAGEQGRGFAVVATEVRGLAQRCAGAAREIRGLIAEAAGRVEDGAGRVGATGRTMDEIVAAIHAVGEQVELIARASGEQREGIAQISGSIASIDHDTQQNAALVEQGSATAATLSQAAQALVELVGSFRIREREAA